MSSMATTYAAGASVEAPTPTDDKRPNILIVLGDDCSYSDLSCFGGPNAITPNMERLASQGVTFDNCFQATAMSSPTRHCLYTGLYPLTSGAYPNHTFVRNDVKSFVQHFGNIGYRTALYGKEHISPKSVFSYDYLGEYKDGNMNFDRICNYITQDAAQPFFMVVASHESHGPYTVGDPSHWDYKKIKLPPHIVDTEAVRKEYVRYLAEIEVLDSQLGKIMNMLDEEGMADNTVLVFLSEQGNAFPFAKWTCYNQGLHSGMIVRYPGLTQANTRTDALVEYADVLPTMLQLAGEQPAKDYQFSGRSFYDVLAGKTDTHKQYAYGIHTTRGIMNGSEYYGVRSITDGHFSYIINLTPEAEFQCAANKSESRDKDMFGWVGLAKKGNKLAKKQVYRYRHRPAEELYNLDKDPYSLNNLVDKKKYAEVKERLRTQLLNWMNEQGDKGQQTEMEAYEHMCDWAQPGYKKNKK